LYNTLLTGMANQQKMLLILLYFNNLPWSRWDIPYTKKTRIG
jgi:hypothetical protein